MSNSLRISTRRTTSRPGLSPYPTLKDHANAIGSGGLMKQADKDHFLGERIRNFDSAKPEDPNDDNHSRMREFINNSDWEWKATELYAMAMEAHCAVTLRAGASAQSWRRATFLSLTVAILSICLALLSGEVEFLPWVFAFGAVSFSVLFFGGLLIKLTMEER